MEELEVFTVNVFQKRNPDGDRELNGQDESIKPVGEYKNMVSARIIKVSYIQLIVDKMSERQFLTLSCSSCIITQGRVIELEHSNLAGPLVKFKTVVNYERILEPKSYLGTSFTRQETYIE